MQFPRTLLLGLLSAIAAQAANPNPFNVPDNFSATGGQPLDLSWNPTTSGSVSLILRSGASNDLAEGTVIASHISNSGSYTWTPSNSITRGSDYTIEIVDDSDPSQTNYTPYFVLDTTNTVATSTPSISLGQPSSSLMMSTASPSSAATSDDSSSMTSKESTTIISGTRMPTSVTTTDAADTTQSVSTSASNSGMSASAASSNVPTPSSATPNNAGPTAGAKPTIVAGMLGVVALGAFAL